MRGYETAHLVGGFEIVGLGNRYRARVSSHTLDFTIGDYKIPGVQVLGELQELNPVSGLTALVDKLLGREKPPTYETLASASFDIVPEPELNGQVVVHAPKVLNKEGLLCMNGGNIKEVFPAGTDIDAEIVPAYKREVVHTLERIAARIGGDYVVV